MYLRIENNELRFRVSKDEAMALEQGELLTQSCIFATEFCLNFSVQAQPSTNNLVYHATESALQLIINTERLKQELSTRPSKKGIEFNQTIQDKNITISLEIDIKQRRSKQPAD